MLEPVNISLGDIADLGEFPDPFNGGGFPCNPGERPDRGVKISLGLVAGSVDFPPLPFGGGGAFHPVDTVADGSLNDLFHDGRGDRLPSLAVPGGRAPVHPVSRVVVGCDNHSGPAGSAAKHPEAGQEPGRLGFPAAGNRDVLDGLPGSPIHDRLMRLKVDELPEVKFPQDDAGPQETPNPVIRPVNAVAVKELAHLGDRCAISSHLERLPGDRRQFVRNQNPVITLPVAGNVHIPRRNTPGDSPSLTFSHATFHLPSLIFGDKAEKPGVKPLTIGGPGDFTGIEGEHAAPGFLHPVENLSLDLQGSEQPVEVGNDDHIRLAVLDAGKRSGQARTFTEFCPAGHIEFTVDGDEFRSLGFAPLRDPVRLLGWADEAVTFTTFDTGNTDESYGSQGVLKYPTCSPRVLLDTSRKPAFYGAYRPEIRGLMSPSTIWETQLKSEIPGIGDHVTNRKVQGGRYRVHEVTADHLVVRDVMTAVPALIDRSDLDRWRIVWKCERGHEGLTPDPPGLVRVDRALASGGRG